MSRMGSYFSLFRAHLSWKVRLSWPLGGGVSRLRCSSRSQTRVGVTPNHGRRVGPAREILDISPGCSLDCLLVPPCQATCVGGKLILDVLRSLLCPFLVSVSQGRI
jgi:hypothetical protein